MFKNIIAIFMLMFSSMALAADLPKRNSEVIFGYDNTPINWIGVYGGYTINNRGNVGVSIGRQFFPYLGTELSYNYYDLKSYNNYFGYNRKDWHNFSINALPTFDLMIIPVKVYSITGIGYAIGPNRPTWNIGGGLRYNITDQLAFDTRFVHTQSFNGPYRINSIKAGVLYNF